MEGGTLKGCDDFVERIAGFQHADAQAFVGKATGAKIQDAVGSVSNDDLILV